MEATRKALRRASRKREQLMSARVALALESDANAPVVGRTTSSEVVCSDGEGDEDDDDDELYHPSSADGDADVSEHSDAGDAEDG